MPMGEIVHFETFGHTKGPSNSGLSFGPDTIFAHFVAIRVFLRIRFVCFGKLPSGPTGA
jgi:hypothetical protein